MKKIKWIFYLFVVFLLGYCASEEDKKDCKIKSNLPIMAYSHTPDYLTYKLDLIYANGNVVANAITLNSQGFQDVELLHKCDGKSYLVLSDSRATGGAIRIYDIENLSQEVASVPVDGFSQELEIFGELVYYTLLGAPEVRYFSLKNPASPGEVQTISVGTEPAVLLRQNFVLYVGNLDFTNETNPSVSIISLATNQVIKTVKVGQNPTALLWDGTTLFSYNSGYFSNPNPSLSYDVEKRENNEQAPTVSLSGAQNNEKPVFGGTMARAGSKNYILLSPGGWPPPMIRYEFNSSGVFNRDDTKQYLWIGSHPTTLYEAYKEGSEVKLTGGSLAVPVTLVDENDAKFHILEN